MARYCPPGYLAVLPERHAARSADEPRQSQDHRAPSVPILDRVDREPSSGAVHFAISRTGALAFAPRVEGADQAEMIWMSEDGTITPLAAPAERVQRAPHLPRRNIASPLVPITRGDIWAFRYWRQTLTADRRRATCRVSTGCPSGASSRYLTNARPQHRTWLSRCGRRQPATGFSSRARRP